MRDFTTFIVGMLIGVVFGLLAGLAGGAMMAKQPVCYSETEDSTITGCYYDGDRNTWIKE